MSLVFVIILACTNSKPLDTGMVNGGGDGAPYPGGGHTGDSGDSNDSGHQGDSSDSGSWPPATVDGEVAGVTLDVGSAWWGGSLLVVTEQSYGCEDLTWVKGYYSEDDPPVDGDLTALQFIGPDRGFEPSVYDIAGEGVVYGRFLYLHGGDFMVEPTRSGTVVIDSVADGDLLSGSFEVVFDLGTLSGTLLVPWCETLAD